MTKSQKDKVELVKKRVSKGSIEYSEINVNETKHIVSITLHPKNFYDGLFIVHIGKRGGLKGYRYTGDEVKEFDNTRKTLRAIN